MTQTRAAMLAVGFCVAAVVAGFAFVKWRESVRAADLEQGLAALGVGNYALALRRLGPLAEEGNPEAQEEIGHMYDDGTGVPQDYAEAIRWYRLAAAQGNAQAQNSLGFMYDKGNGVPQDYAEAMRWYRLAAAQGLSMAQNNVAFMYLNGVGVSPDVAEAVRWYGLAAAQGNAGAQYVLGYLYEMGDGVPQDLVQALMWDELAESGFPPGTNRMEAEEARDRLSAEMTPDQIAEAKRFVGEWHPTVGAPASP
jgi:TPR repeat protein